MTAVLQFVPKPQQQKLPEKLQEQIKSVTQKDTKFYNRLCRFFLQSTIQDVSEIGYEHRKAYIEWIEQEDLSEKYRAALISLFDRLKIETMPEVKVSGVQFSIEQPFFQSDVLFLLYVPNKQKARSFRKVYDKEDLLWDLSDIKYPILKQQTKVLLCEILNMDLTQRRRREYLEPLKVMIRFCNKYGISNIEEMEQTDENRLLLFASTEIKNIKNRIAAVVEFARRTLFLTDETPNWNARVWYLERFQIAKSRLNESSPVVSISFLRIQNKENRECCQLYAKYLIGISDLAISNARCILGFVQLFLLYLDDRGISVSQMESEDMEDYVAFLNAMNDIKYSTFNRYIADVHTFLQFLKMIGIETVVFDPAFYIKKGYTEHNNRSVPADTIGRIIKELPTFPEHLQLMYLILLCTGIRKSEVCTIRAGSFYQQSGDAWMRVYQPKMNKEKVVPVPKVLVELVKEYEESNHIIYGEYLFRNSRGAAFNSQTFSNQMIAECKVRQIDCGEYIFRAHDYRHTLATALHEKGVSIQGIRDYLGHSSEDMTKQYLDFMPERIVSAENKYFTNNQSFELKGVERNGEEHQCD